MDAVASSLSLFSQSQLHRLDLEREKPGINPAESKISAHEP
jgi:hypothetical protein